MASKAVFSDEKTVVIDIHGELETEKLLTNEQNSHRVCISHVPESLKSVNPNAFIPQFVGLGPYHHFSSELIITDELKFSVAERVLKVKTNLLPNTIDLFLQRLQDLLPDIQAFYDVDVTFSYDHANLSYILFVDALFLLALLRRERESFHYIFTGKPYGLPLVNAAGVELTWGGVINDIFRVENQIPIHVLVKINETRMDEIQQVSMDLGSTMLRFCQELCPLVHVKSLSKDPHAYHHLLDLMYHLVEASELEPEPEPEPEPKPHLQPSPEDMRWLTKCLFFITINLAVLIVLSVRLILSLLSSFLRLVQLVNAAGPFPSLFVVLNNIYDDLYYDLPESSKLQRELILQTKEMANRFIGRLKSLARLKGGQSVTELSNFGIQLQPAEGGISSIKFNAQSYQFSLPSIRLDVTSQVIITNLIAYESLTKSNYFIFRRYIALMSSLIRSVEDVKLLVQQEIIETRLSDEAVVELFNGMSKQTIRSAKIPKLEKEIRKVNDVFFKKSLKWLGVVFLTPLTVFVILSLPGICYDLYILTMKVLH